MRSISGRVYFKYLIKNRLLSNITRRKRAFIYMLLRFGKKSRFAPIRQLAEIGVDNKVVFGYHCAKLK